MADIFDEFYGSVKAAKIARRLEREANKRRRQNRKRMQEHRHPVVRSGDSPEVVLSKRERQGRKKRAGEYGLMVWMPLELKEKLDRAIASRRALGIDIPSRTEFVRELIRREVGEP